MPYEIIKPNWPKNKDAKDGFYPYLATVGLTHEKLRNSCIKKGIVTGIFSAQSVNITIDNIEYTDVPVWMHTDHGAREQLIKEEVLVDQSNYFKNAALMFPFPGNISTSSGTTLEPEVLVIVYTNPETSVVEVIAVIGILQNVFQIFDTVADPYPTYNLYFYFKIVSERWEATGSSNEYPGELKGSRELYFLYDMINDTVANIPTIIDSEPSLPFFNAENILQADTDKITDFISSGVIVPISPTIIVPDVFTLK